MADIYDENFLFGSVIDEVGDDKRRNNLEERNPEKILVNFLVSCLRVFISLSLFSLESKLL